METKDKILKIAFKLFIERGFLEVSINDLTKEAGIAKRCFNEYFVSKDQLICETIEKLFSRFDDIIKIPDEFNGLSKEKLLRIFQRYSEMESYLKINLSVRKFNYNSIICLTIEGMKCYESMTNCIIDFNNRLLKKIEYIIEEGKILGEISSSVDSKSTAKYTLASLQSNMVLWAMNQNIDIKMLYETDFGHIWNNIESCESNFVILDNNIINKCIASTCETNFYLM